MAEKEYFLKIFKKAEKKYGPSLIRLAAEGWAHDWQILISTIMSAQSRDDMTIIVSENLFKKYHTLEKLAKARYSDVLKILKSMNYNKTKAKHVIASAKMLVKEFNSKIPDTIEELVKLPGVGRKTANLVVTEAHKKDGLTVDTHVHRISNVFGFVKTKTRDQTEFALRELVPKRLWMKVNRIFVLWGKDVPGKDKKRLLRKLEEKN
tara:strand:+ start:8686 stop:9306 length:621 start_codon:yes stop_codon:yes gene_type:complete